MRRCLALAIDLVIVSLLLPSSGGTSDATGSSDEATARAAIDASGSRLTPAQRDAALKLMHERLTSRHVPHGIDAALTWLTTHAWLAVQAASGSVVLVVLVVYAVVLVGLAGQTLGMMVCDVRVVDLRDGRASLRGSLARYAASIASFVLLFGFFTMFRRVQPFERWSRTRLVIGNALPESGRG